MDSLVHPTQLSVWQRFLQARRLHKETSRSKNADWYRPALQLDYQLHLFVDEDEITDAHLCNQRDAKTVWTRVTAPKLDQDEEALLEYVKQFKAEHLKGKARSLGVVLHLADEFAISELANATDAPEELDGLKKQLVYNPTEVLEDGSVSVDELSFRLFPYPGAKPGQSFGAAITISKKHHDYLRQFRVIGEDLSFPIVTSALSAPLVALGALPRMASELPTKPFCIFFSYTTFSVLAFFNADGDLVMLRSVRHHAGGTPPHVGRIIQTMAAALELPEPMVFVLPLSQGRQGEIVAGFPELPNASVLDWRETNEFEKEVPLEFQGTLSLATTSEEPTGLAASQTFQDLAARQWATQDFLTPSQDETDLYPEELEMKALRFGSLGLKVGAVLLVLFAVWTGISAFGVLRNPAWHAAKHKVSAEGNKVLAKQIKRYEQWDAFLAERSKAWVTMELVSQLFPNPDSVVLTEVTHRVRPDLVARQSQPQASLSKDWDVKGFVKEEAFDHLLTLNTRDGINDAFDSVFQVTGNESLRTDLKSRNLVVNLITNENKRYDPHKGATVEAQFPYIFHLTIKQQVTSDDPIAIPTVAAP